MAKQSRDDLRKALKQGELAEVYLLHGPEGFLRDSAARAITEAVLGLKKDDPLRAFCDLSFNLLTDDLNDALATAEQLPMMAARLVVRIECALPRGAKLSEEQEAAILGYAQRPAPSSVVIFVLEEMDKRFKFSKTIQEICYAVEFAPLKDDELRKWAGDRFRDLNTSIDGVTLSHLVGLAGSDVRNLMGEINKLATAALPRGVVTADLVDQLVPRSREQNNFELTDKLLAGDRGAALGILERMMTDGAEPLMVIGLLASNYHKLALTKDLMAQGKPVAEVLRIVGYKPDSFISCARRSDSARLAQSLQLIADADLAIKTSLATPRMQIELLVCALASQN